tara:strand:+ start:298 stop:1053 length:756 start_codon:yes stop_codon:yes gene_type:complete
MKIIKIKSKWKRLIMFDFDETLAITEEVTLVREKKSNRIVDHLHGQAQFDAHTIDEKKYYYDFSEFMTVSSHAKPINATLDLMRDFLNDKDNKVIVLTARQSASRDSISDFLDRQGIESKRVSVFGSGGSKLKAPYLTKLIKRFNISESVLVFEDSLQNISDMISLEYDFPSIEFNFVQVINPDSDEDLEEAKKYKYPKGKYGTEKYQRMLKKIHPAMKRRLIGLGGNDYLVKGQKKNKDFSRSKSAPPGG